MTLTTFMTTSADNIAKVSDGSGVDSDDGRTLKSDSLLLHNTEAPSVRLNQMSRLSFIDCMIQNDLESLFIVGLN